MTREEAIKILKSMSDISTQGKAIDMAIEALHQKGAYEQTKWERDVALQTLEEHGIGLGQKVEYIIPNGGVMFTSADCSTCKHKDKDWDSEECDSCCGNNNHYTLAEAEEMVIHKLLEKGMIEIPQEYVAVVRCKDCKWYKACKVFSNNAWHDDDYCSYGKRREK